jgi:hypothetical protein
VRVYIQSVPDRDEYCSTVLVPALEAQGFQDIRRITDHDKHGPLWNARRIWEQIAHEDSPALILQDDVILHRDLSWHLSVILAVMKEEGWQAVSLFAPPRADMDRFHAAGYNYVENYRFLWMPGMILTPAFCAGLLQYETHHTKHDDSVVGGYSSSTGIPIWNTLPSLVQHNLDIRSTLGTANKVGKTVRETRVWDEALVPEHFGTVNSTRYGRPDPATKGTP